MSDKVYLEAGERINAGDVVTLAERRRWPFFWRKRPVAAVVDVTKTDLSMPLGVVLNDGQNGEPATILMGGLNMSLPIQPKLSRWQRFKRWFRK
jgi:hypothetical protein